MGFAKLVTPVKTLMEVIHAQIIMSVKQVLKYFGFQKMVT